MSGSVRNIENQPVNAFVPSDIRPTEAPALPALGKIEQDLNQMRKREHKYEIIKEFIFLHLAKAGLGTATGVGIAVPGIIMLASVLGILIASNPVGWAIGIAAISGGIIAITAASIAIYKGKMTNPADILVPLGIGAVVGAFTLVVVGVLLLMAKAGSSGGFSGGGGSGNLSFFQGVLFAQSLQHGMYPNDIFNFNYLAKEELPIENLHPYDAKEKLNLALTEKIIPIVEEKADVELKDMVRNGIGHLKKHGVIKEEGGVPSLNHEQFKNAYEYAADLLHSHDFLKAGEVLSVLYQQNREDEQLTKELAYTLGKAKNSPYNIAAKMQIKAVTKESTDPLFIKNLALALDHLNHRHEALQLLSYRYLIAKNELREKVNIHQNEEFIMQAEKLIGKFSP